MAFFSVLIISISHSLTSVQCRMFIEKDIETHRMSNKVYIDNKTARVLIKHEIPNNIISIHTTNGGVGKNNCYNELRHSILDVWRTCTYN